MPIIRQGWELHIQRVKEQTRNGRTRTVGTYQVFHDGEPAASIRLGNIDVPLSGMTAESPGPGQNETPATDDDPSRIREGRYPLKTSGGPRYKTTGYREDEEIKPAMPGIELRKTGKRSDIIVHPGKNEFLSSIGCINPCTSLPTASEPIDYAGSRRRVIALIEDMRAFLGGISDQGDVPILNASVVIDGEPLAASVAFTDSIDGEDYAEQHGIKVKNNSVKISSLHPAMAPVFAAVAMAASQLNLPTPVITSGNDSNHKHGSLHFKNRALDFRGNNISVAKGREFAKKVASVIGSDYDVLFETFADSANNHLHVEYDPT